MAYEYQIGDEIFAVNSAYASPVNCTGVVQGTRFRYNNEQIVQVLCDNPGLRSGLPYWEYLADEIILTRELTNLEKAIYSI